MLLSPWGEELEAAQTRFLKEYILGLGFCDIQRTASGFPLCPISQEGIAAAVIGLLPRSQEHQFFHFSSLLSEGG